MTGVVPAGVVADLETSTAMYRGNVLRLPALAWGAEAVGEFCICLRSAVLVDVSGAAREEIGSLSGGIGSRWGRIGGSGAEAIGIVG